MYGNVGVEKIVRSKKPKKKAKYEEQPDQRDHHRRNREAKRSWQ